MASSRRAGACRAWWIVLFASMLFVSFTASVFADSPPEQPPVFPASQEFTEAIKAEAEGSHAVVPNLTDPGAAEGIPHRDLGRGEALELLEGVFGPELEGPAGPFDELRIEKYLASNVAVIGPGEQPEESLSAFGEEGGHGYEGATLLESSVPLRTEAASGEQETVDLGLEHAEGQLKQANPIVEVDVPQELGEGVDLPEPGVQIELAGAPDERVASTADKSVAFYPNVAKDTDFAVAPTPTGVETLTQLRSSAAPHWQTLNLSLPAGADLHATKNGGAEVTRDEETLVGIAPPTAIDANGAKVPVSLEVTGNSLTLEVSSEESTQFPVLLDPLFQTYEWYAKNTRAGINIWKTGEEEWSREEIQHSGGYKYLCNNICTLGQEAPLSYELPGLWVQKGEVNTSGDHASWIYTVPRYFTDQSQYGERPHSFINHMTLSNLYFKGIYPANSPYLVAGLWDPNNGWASLLQHEGSAGHGLTDMSYAYQFTNPNTNTNVKLASAGLWSLESGTNGVSHLYVGTATMELAEPANDVPGFGSISGPSQWVNQTAAPIEFTVSDAGLGVYAMTVTDAQSPPHSWKTPYGCVGVGDSACPHTWKSTDAGHPALKYEPSVLPQGTNTLKIVAEDPLGHVSTSANVQVKVDRTAPELTLSGPLTEQAALGWNRASYALNLNAADGTEAAPQSGVAKAVVEVDGKVAYESAPGCLTKNCPLSREWTLDASQYSLGQHTVTVKATDAVSLTTTKTLTIELRSAPPPSVSVSGGLTEQGTLGTKLPVYGLRANVSSEAGLEVAPPTVPTFNSAFGSWGSGSGQFFHPAGIAIDSKGNPWVADSANGRVEGVNPKGEFLGAFATKGPSALESPVSLAIDAKGNFWVTGYNYSSVEEFSQGGEHLKSVGAGGSGNGQFQGAEGVAIDPKGNLWVTDAHNGRLQEFNEKGEFIKVVGSKGSGAGQFGEPTRIAVGPGNNVFAVDYANNRIEEFDEAGKFVRQFGSSGTGNGQLSQPDAITVDPKGNVWVADVGNNRIEEFNQAGEYLAQFSFEAAPRMGIAADAYGRLWISRPYSNLVEKWRTTKPQSEVSLEISIGGKAVDSKGASCATESCALEREWTLESSAYSVGAHTAQVKATDILGRTTTKSVAFELHPAPPPSVTLSGSATEEASLGTTRPRYVLKWKATSDKEAGTTTPGGTFASAFGSEGSGKGRFSWPTGVAADSAGNVWVADTNNSRIQEFDSEGKYLRQSGSYGSGNGQFSEPYGIATDAKGNVWVADTYNNRIEEFNAEGKYLRQVDSAYLQEPTGLATDGEGNVWVTDWYDGVREFNSEGKYLRQFGSYGYGQGQFSGPQGIAIDAKGNVWVADTYNNRVQELTSNGGFLRQVGSSGSGAGLLSSPTGVVVDPEGDVWVMDYGNMRVEGFDSEGKYLSQFGVYGTEDGQFVEPYGLALGPQGALWVVDPGRNRVQKWNLSHVQSKITTEASIDGKVVAASKETTCEVEVCMAEREWALESPNYATGSHSVQVKATDSLGRSTTKSQPIEVQRDTTKPTLEASGELFEAPEGWVEQESYGLNVSATDAGFGATSLAFKIDGSTVTSQTQECPEGGCKESISKSINMASYSGGSHSAEILATDGAGNTTTKHWTINVDPEGHITASEADDTLEAADSTSESTVVAPTDQVLDPEQIEGGDNPGLQISGSEITSTGVPDTTTMTTNTGDGFTIHSPEGATTITPIVSENASAVSITAGVAGVSANIGNEVDSVIRPEYNGVQTFQAIRSESSPENYSWRVHLAPEQELRYVNPAQAEVAYEDGTTAFLITAENAHDATGLLVPTSLEVNGDVLTLKIEFHSGNFVYPIVSGQGWETTYAAPVIVERPEDEAEILQREREEREQEERERAEAEGIEVPEGEEPPPPPLPLTQKQAEWFISFGSFGTDPAPPPYPTGGASASTVRTFQVYRSQCGPSCSKWNAKLYNASFLRGYNWAKWEPGTEVHAKVDQNWKYELVFLNTTWNCGTFGPTFVKKASGEHMTAYAHFTIEDWFGASRTPRENNFALQDWIYPNGFQEKHIKEWSGAPADQTCPRVAG